MQIRWWIGGAALFACSGGGDPAAPPEPAFPAVGGSYVFTLMFENFPVSEARVTGTLVLMQPTRELGTLSGTFTAAGSFLGNPMTLSGLNSPSVTETGQIRFSSIAGSGHTFVFNGTVSGTTMTGRYELEGNALASSGPWTATRTSAARPLVFEPPGPHAHAVSHPWLQLTGANQAVGLATGPALRAGARASRPASPR